MGIWFSSLTRIRRGGRFRESREGSMMDDTCIAQLQLVLVYYGNYQFKEGSGRSVLLGWI